MGSSSNGARLIGVRVRVRVRVGFGVRASVRAQMVGVRAGLTVRQSRPGGTVHVHEGHGSDITHRAQRPRRRVFNLMKVRNFGKVGGGLHAGEGEGWGWG